MVSGVNAAAIKTTMAFSPTSRPIWVASGWAAELIPLRD
jgi:hypothetical protein|tara:strand:+ start:396 stop:512 length:117 start_codon:yes stop_codon:yes gene_type:complete